METEPLLKGVIFDMDGVLVDSEPFICQAAIRMLAEKGVTAQPEDFEPFVGTGENRYLGGVAEKYGLTLDIELDKARAYAIYFDLIKGKLAPLPGALDFIWECANREWELALATSADRCKAEANLEAIGLDIDLFTGVITGDDVENKKPAPDIFLAAAKALGLSPSACLVVEDAPSGILAAREAGARALALTTTFEKERLPGADWYAPNLAAVPPEALIW